MKTKYILILFTLLIQSINLYSQTEIITREEEVPDNSYLISVNTRSMDSIRNIKKILIKFDYSNMTVCENFVNESEFVNKKVIELNASEPGKGEKWKNEWYGKRTTMYEPNFVAYFNNGARSIGLSCSKEYDDSEFLMTVHTTHTNIVKYLGSSYSLLLNNVTIKYIPSYINAEITISRISSGKEIVKFYFLNFEAKSINESYSILGKKFAKHLKKSLK